MTDQRLAEERARPEERANGADTRGSSASARTYTLGVASERRSRQETRGLLGVGRVGQRLEEHAGEGRVTCRASSRRGG